MSSVILDRSQIQLVIENFIKGGLIIGISIAIIEMIYKSQKLINVFAFLSGSFFLINLYQFYYISNKNPSLNKGFLHFSVWGGLGWVFFAAYMYIAHWYMSPNMVVFTSVIVYFLVILGFCGLMEICDRSTKLNQLKPTCTYISTNEHNQRQYYHQLNYVQTPIN